MIIDIDKINKLLEMEDISADYVFSKTGISRTNYRGYKKNGNLNIMNMSLNTAMKLQELYEEVSQREVIGMKIKGVKKAVGDFNNWQGAARVYFDMDELKVWTNIYEGPGSWDDYHDNAIVEVYSKATFSILERDNEISMRDLQLLCEEKLTQ